MRPSGRMLLSEALPLQQLHHFEQKILVPNINVGKHPPPACDKWLNLAQLAGGRICQKSFGVSEEERTWILLILE